MKKLIPLLLAAALCLCAGCGEVTPSATPTPIPTPEATPTSTPTPVPTPEPEIIYEVQTDYSQYSSYEKETVESVYTRLSEDWIDGLAPRDDYGMLYPFAATALINNRGYIDGYVYGLFDESGRIVCDGVYTAVERLSYRRDRGEVVCLPALALSRTVDGEIAYTITALDGSWTYDCGYYKSTGFGIICSDSNLSKEFEIIDFKGRVIMTSAALQLNGLQLAWGAGSVSGCEDKILTLDLVKNEGDYSRSYYCGLDGVIFAGPFSMSHDFSGGRAIVAQSQSHWGLIDTKGNWVIQPEYKDMKSAGNGTYSAQKTSGGYNSGCVVFDKSGKELFSNNIMVTSCSYGYRDSYDGRLMYDKNGQPAPFNGQGWRGLAAGFGVDCPILHRYDSDSGQTELMNCLSGKTVTLEGNFVVDQVFINWVMGQYSSLEYVFAWNNDDISASPYLISWDLERQLLLEDSGYTGMGCCPVVVDMLTGEEYLTIVNSSYQKQLWSADMETMLADIGQWTGVCGGYIVNTNDDSCTYTDLDGNILFRYPLVLPDGD